MAKTKAKKGSARTSLEDVNQSLTNVEQKLEQNKKYIYYALGAVVAIVAIVLIYIYAIRQPGIEKANKEIAKADMVYFDQGNQDSALVLYKRVADKYGYDAGNRAAIMAGELLYQKGKYPEALKYLEKADAKGKFMGTALLIMRGDCYVNTKQQSKALTAYDEAVKQAGEQGQQLASYALVKKATVLHADKKYDEEIKTFEELKQKFPGLALQLNADKYIERAKALSGK